LLIADLEENTRELPNVIVIDKTIPEILNYCHEIILKYDDLEGIHESYNNNRASQIVDELNNGKNLIICNNIDHQ
jgi:hypothetical protein